MNEPERYLSIITNFGCHYECPYCVVKTNRMDIPRTSIKSLRTLRSAIEYEKANIISVSGGGDPLHEYDKNSKYYKFLLRMCKNMNIPLEMHTSYLDSNFPYEKCYRVVYHCRDIKQLETIYKHGNEIIRVVFVVTEDFTNEKIDEIANFVANSDVIDELSFRQMTGKDFRTTNYCQDYLRSSHKDRWWYIEQCDYNPYFVNGEIYYRFEDIGRY